MSTVAVVAVVLVAGYLCLVIGSCSVALQSIAEELRWRNARTQEEDERRNALVAGWEAQNGEGGS